MSSGCDCDGVRCGKFAVVGFFDGTSPNVVYRDLDCIDDWVWDGGLHAVAWVCVDFARRVDVEEAQLRPPERVGAVEEAELDTVLLI